MKEKIKKLFKEILKEAHFGETSELYKEPMEELEKLLDKLKE